MVPRTRWGSPIVLVSTTGRWAWCAADRRPSRAGREWRNRQTRTVQVRVPERAWGFNSPLAHHESSSSDLRLCPRPGLPRACGVARCSTSLSSEVWRGMDRQAQAQRRRRLRARRVAHRRHPRRRLDGYGRSIGPGRRQPPVAPATPRQALCAKMTALGTSSSGPMTSSASIVNPASRSQSMILLGRRR